MDWPSSTHLDLASWLVLVRETPHVVEVVKVTGVVDVAVLDEDELYIYIYIYVEAHEDTE